MHQQKITLYAKRRYRADPGAGDMITAQKGQRDIRVFLQNPNGVMGKDTKHDDRRALLSLREWGADVISLPETNCNWKTEWLRNKWSSEVQRVWRHSKVFYASIDKPADPRATYLPGGACLIVAGKWASRVIENGSDTLGRWVWATLQGRQNERLTFVSLYRPNLGTIASGPATVWSQQRSRMAELATAEDSTLEYDPRKQCLIDFNNWMKNRTAAGHRVVVLTDSNQTLTDGREKYNLKDLVSDRSLLSAMEAKHREQSVNSVDRGTNTIDHILTQGVRSTDIHKAGQLPFGLGFHTDHRGVFADMDSDELLKLWIEEPEQRDYRRLSSKNAKHRHQYLAHLVKHLESHNVYERVGELGRGCQNGSLNADQETEYNKIDTAITEGMIAAENSLPKKRERGWTAELNRLIHRVRYYKLLLRRNRGLPVRDDILQKVKDLAEVTWEVGDDKDARCRLRDTWKSVLEQQKQAEVKRDKHLRDLAEETNCPDKEKALKIIKTREASKRQFRRIRTTLGRLKAGGLAGVDVPIIGADGEITGWRSVTEPEELHELISVRNKKHLNQAAPTPLGHGEGFRLFHGKDRHDTARKVLNGELEWRHPISEVNDFIGHLKKAFNEEKLREETKKINVPVTTAEFRFYFSKKKESTESSPSGRHIGHYKAILDNDDIVDLLVAMINIGIMTGHALNRWQHAVSVMLEKDKGRPKIDRLRIIQLFEADYNFFLSLVFGHRLMGFARRHCQFNESQYGSLKGKQAQSAILNKILTYDYFRLQREDAATSEFDAAANYDRILPAIAVIACQRLGLAVKAGDLLYSSLEKLTHRVRTLYGLSTAYGTTADCPLFGSGQGSGGSPTFWAVIADALFNTIDDYGHGLSLQDPRATVRCNRNEDGYVDDTSLGVDGRDNNPHERIITAAQRHERVLYATGGKLALKKCTWVLITWAWEGGQAYMKGFEQGNDDAHNNHRLRLVQSETGEEVEIPRLAPDEAYRTLGAWIAASGDQRKQLEVLRSMVSEWTERVQNSSLGTHDRQISYSMFLRPQLQYPLGCASIQHKDIKRLFRPVLTLLLHTLGLNRNFPLALVHSGPEDLGLGIDEFPTTQGIAQLQLLLGHLNVWDRTGKLIAITLGTLELEIGLGKCPLWHPHTTTLEHVTPTWLTSIGEFLHRTGCRLEIRAERQMEVQRENDRFIMQIALDGKYDMRKIQQCRLRMQVCTLADICDASGRKVESWAMTGPGRRSKLKWIRQGQPSPSAWREWRRMIRSLTTAARAGRGQHLKHTYIMKRWYSTHQEWEWVGNNSVVFQKEGKRYWREGTSLREMDRTLQYAPSRLYPVGVHVAPGGCHRVRDPDRKNREPNDEEAIYRRLRGHVLPTATVPYPTDKEEDIVIATDGTVKRGKGGAACTVHTTECPGTIRSVIPVDGGSHPPTSYRAELFGILGALLILHQIMQGQKRRWERLTAVLWCDNQAAVNKFNQLRGRRHYSIASANHTDSDVLQELRVWKDAMPIDIQARWVKSHQTNCDTRESRLNHVADRLAAMQHEATEEWATSTTSTMLPHTKAQLHLPNGRYTGRVHVGVQYGLRGESARNYICHKLRLGAARTLVDWESLGQHHRSLSWQRRATRLKLVFRWAPTMARMRLVGHSETSVCPQCEEESETIAHVMSCGAPLAVAAKSKALMELERSLDEIGTHPDMIGLICKAADNGQEPECEEGENDQTMENVKEAQRRIGWSLLRYGFLATEWRKSQLEWAQARDPNFSPKKIVRWAKLVQESLWDFVSAIWDHRNKVIHGKDEEEALRNRLKRLRKEVQGVLQAAPALGAADRHLLDLRDVDRRNGQYLHHWLRAVRGAARKEKLRRDREERHNILAYLRNVRNRQRRDPPRVLHQATLFAYMNEPNEVDRRRVPGIGVTRRSPSTSPGRCQRAPPEVASLQND